MAEPRAVGPEPAQPPKPAAPAAPPDLRPAVDLGEESVAGEEDPGAALDVDAEPAEPPRRDDAAVPTGQRRPTTSG